MKRKHFFFSSLNSYTFKCGEVDDTKFMKNIKVNYTLLP